MAFTSIYKANALSSDREQPAHIEADRTQWNEKQGMIVFNGNVLFKQGTLFIKANTGKVFRNAQGEIARIVIQGKPVYLQQQLDNQKGLFNARSRKMDYDLLAEKLVLSGNVVIKQEQGELKSQCVEYQLLDGQVYGNAGVCDNDSRVMLRIDPISDEDK